MSAAQRFAHSVNRMFREDRIREERLAFRWWIGSVIAVAVLILSLILVPVVCRADTPQAPRPRAPMPVAKPAFREATGTEYRIPHATGWVMDGGHATVSHVISHGCPAPVANMYRNQPAILDQIHSGYHEQERGGNFGWWTVTVPKMAVAAAKPKPVALPVFQSGGGCPGGICPLPSRARRHR